MGKSKEDILILEELSVNFISKNEKVSYKVYINNLKNGEYSLIFVKYGKEFKSLLINNMMNLSEEGIFITDSKMNIIDINTSFCNFIGYKKFHFLGKRNLITEIFKIEKKIIKKIFHILLKNNYWEGELYYINKSGENYPANIKIKVIRDNKNLIKGYIGIIIDKKEQKLSEEQFEYLAYHDILTKLPNRLLLLTKLDQTLKEAKRVKHCVALLFLDLDRFKNINDSFGHSMGDELLQKVALRLIRRLRDIDVISRFGGDEFAILLPNIRFPEDAGFIAQKVIDIISEPWLLSNGIEVRVGVSIGISTFTDNSISPEEMLQFSDAALYRAKKEGGNTFVYYENEMTVAAQYKIKLESRLRRAIENKEFVIYYQPQMDIKNGNLIGAEALIRWLDPELGLIYPDVFIPIAEETGRIKELGKFVLEEVCRQGKKWEDMGFQELKLCINISAYELQYTNIVDNFSSIFKKIGFNPKNIELEITEGSLITNPEKVLNILHQLRTKGVSISIDDFGTGYSSLSYLKQFPLDVLKIDKSFIIDIPKNKDDIDITKTIIKMGEALGFKIVAEGVERKEQLDFLVENNCDYIQGYYESQAIPASKFEDTYLKIIKDEKGI